MGRWLSEEGSLLPLGASWVPGEKAFNFSLYSKHAHEVELLFFSEDRLSEPLYTFRFDHLSNKSGPLWHCRIKHKLIRNAQFYAYRIEGPPPESGYALHCFDAEKLLLDPYAKDVFFPPEFDRQAAISPGCNMGRAPLAVLERATCDFDWNGDRVIPHEHDLVIYEMHVKGFTRNPNSGLPEVRRGTFLGVIDKIPYLKELGVTAVELMPVFQFDPLEANYWGYMPINFFAPHSEYATAEATGCQRIEFCRMVRELHRAGIEVILDVVYNHTGEGNEDGPTYSLKGIDSSTYYMMQINDHTRFANFSGTGNTLHTANRAVRRLVMDSLRYWVTEMRVDGFRFDLASAFTRTSDGGIDTVEPPIFGQIAGESQLECTRLIAEPWDAEGAYQLGRGFPGWLWAQWNGEFRDISQRFMRGDPGMIGPIMQRIYGSDDLFPDDRHHAMHPYQSINYITSHDGFSLYDLTAFNHRHNWANGHENTDGSVEYSWNCGWEGDEDVPPEVMRLRKQQVKNFCCLLMVSNGVPMIRMGDEFLQTQAGNNNPYNQDNETSWLDWDRLEKHSGIFRFFQLMIRFRKSHPTLGRNRFWREDVKWFGASESPDLSESSRTIAFCLYGSSEEDDDLYVMFNAYWEPLEFGIFEGRPGEWLRVVDTRLESPDDILEEDNYQPHDSTTYVVGGRSAVVLLRKRLDSV